MAKTHTHNDRWHDNSKRSTMKTNITGTKYIDTSENNQWRLHSVWNFMYTEQTLGNVTETPDVSVILICTNCFDIHTTVFSPTESTYVCMCMFVWSYKQTQMILYTELTVWSLTTLAYCTKHSPSSEPNLFSAIREIPHILWNQNVHYHV